MKATELLSLLVMIIWLCFLDVAVAQTNIVPKGDQDVDTSSFVVDNCFTEARADRATCAFATMYDSGKDTEDPYKIYHCFELNKEDLIADWTYQRYYKRNTDILSTPSEVTIIALLDQTVRDKLCVHTIQTYGDVTETGELTDIRPVEAYCTFECTGSPSASPTVSPTSSPSSSPSTASPTRSTSPSTSPTTLPSAAPSASPSAAPSVPSFRPALPPATSAGGSSSTALVALVAVVAVCGAVYYRKHPAMNQLQSSKAQSELLELLSDNETYKQLVEFCSQFHAEENVKFVKSIISFETNIYDELGELKTSKEIQTLARKIMKQYIVENAPSQVNLDHATRRKLIATTQFKNTSFQPAKKEILKVIRSNFSTKFKKHQQLQKAYTLDIMPEAKDSLPA